MSLEMYLKEVYGKGGIYAKVVADSIANDVRLTTLELRYHRFIHAEFMTHRMFSRNASSSRAIPVAKMLEQVSRNPAKPIHWGKNQPGMQAKEEQHSIIKHPDGKSVNTESVYWDYCANSAASYAHGYERAGFHKQVVNRLTEPFQFIKVVVTATEWDNFFDLRLHPDAQPEIQELARVMKKAMTSNRPTQIGFRKYHLPYVSDEEQSKFSLDKVIKCSVARCARVSYMNHDKSSPDIDKDVALHDMLLESEHMSPFEHAASPMIESYADSMWADNIGDTVVESPGDWEGGITHMDKNRNYWSGNLRGWVQYRQTL
jgi:hypothetical protein